MPDTELPLITAEVLGVPLLAHPGKLANFLAVFGPRLLAQADWSMVIEAEQVQHRDHADYTVADGIAIIPLIGSLVHRGRRMNSSGMTAYQAFERNLTLAQNDSSVQGILLDMDTPGGQVAGAFDLAARMLAMRGHKRMVAVASDLSASAGYLLGCCADELVVTQTGTVGSIGVVMAHMDRSEEMKTAGRAMTYIYAGDHKVDGHPYAPLPASVKADLQAEINELYQLFTAHVGKARGIGQQAAIDTQARLFLGQKAVDAGLADRVGTLESEFERLKRSAVTPGAGARRFATQSPGEPLMDTPQETGSGPQTSTPQAQGEPNFYTGQTALSQAELDSLKAQQFEAGVGAERERITGIMAVGEELNIGGSTVKRMISSGQPLESARELMAGIKEDAEAHSAIHSQHDSGVLPKKEAAPIDHAAIYAARKGGR